MIANLIGYPIGNPIRFLSDLDPIRIPRPVPTRTHITYVRFLVGTNSPNPKSSLTYRASLATFGLGSFA